MLALERFDKIRISQELDEGYLLFLMAYMYNDKILYLANSLLQEKEAELALEREDKKEIMLELDAGSNFY
jgi:hypothetical protein